MKKLILISIGFFLMMNLFAQAPDYFHYQAVLRNPDGTLMINKEVSIQVELIQGSIDGSSIYIENHSVLSNERGMVVLKIGDGTFFNEIQWEMGPFFLGISVDGQFLGTSQLLSVPYALYARRAGSVYDGDSDPTNEFQTLSIDGSSLEISDGNSVILPDVVTPWFTNSNGIHYYTNVGIGSGAILPDYPLDIVKNISGGKEGVLIRLQNLDESSISGVIIALEAYKDIITKAFYRTELMQTSSEYKAIPDFDGMTALTGEGKGVSLVSKSDFGSIRFYSNTAQDTIIERARIDHVGNMGIGTSQPQAKLHVADGDVFIEDINRGIIMQSPNGKYWRYTAGNDGNLVHTEISIK